MVIILRGGIYFECTPGNICLEKQQQQQPMRESAHQCFVGRVDCPGKLRAQAQY